MICVKLLTGFEERNKVSVFSTLGGKLLGFVDARSCAESFEAFEERTKRFVAKKMQHEHNFSWKCVKLVLDEAQRRATAMWDDQLALDVVRKEHCRGHLRHCGGPLEITVPNGAICAEVQVLNDDASLVEQGYLDVEGTSGTSNKEFVDLSLLAGLTRVTVLSLENINFHADKLPPLLKKLSLHCVEIGRLVMPPLVDRVNVTHSKGLTCESFAALDLRKLTINYHPRLAMPQLANLVSLTRLDLARNKMSGHVPCELGLLTSLERLDLCHNKLCNSIPTELGNMASIKELYMSHNLLTNVLPTELGRLSQLESLCFTNNKLRGAIPTEFGNLVCLSRLRLARNGLTDIPTELGDLHDLKVLDLSNNKFKHAIPTEIGNLGCLSELYLANNRLEGCIPTEFGNLNRLEVVDLSKNRLEGCIPTQFGNLTRLEVLNLANNRLGGYVPFELKNLNLLRDLDLKNNRFEGSHPKEL